MQKISISTNFTLSILALCAGLLACNFGQVLPQTESVPASNAPQGSQPLQPPPPTGNVIDPVNIEYLGAIRLPEGEEPPQTFAYSGNAMTFNSDGDSTGAQDGFPGSLFTAAVAREAWARLRHLEPVLTD